MSTSQPPNERSARAVSIGLICCLVFGVLIILQFKDRWSPDLSAIYFAARSYGLGDFDLIYLSLPEFFGGSASEEWKQMVADLGYEGEPTLPYVYAPIWAAILAPFAVSMPPIAFFNAFLVIHACALTGSIWLAYRIADTGRVSFLVWVAVSLGVIILTTPFFFAFRLNQPHILVTFLVLLAFERYRAGHAIWAGIVLGVTIALKLTPAYFGLIFLLDRNWKAAAATAITGLSLLAASVAIAGWQLHLDFRAQLGRVTENFIVTPINFSLEGVLQRIHDLWSGTDVAFNNELSFYITDGSPVLGLVSLTVFALGVLVIWRATAHLPTPEGLFSKMLALWAISVLCGPLAWSHYVMGPLLLLPGLLMVVRCRLAVAILLIVGVALSHPVQFVATAARQEPIWMMGLGATALIVMFGAGILAARARVSSMDAAGQTPHP